jgi:hypothetical protein
METPTLVPLIRSKWHLEVSAAQLALAQGSDHVPAEDAFISQALGDDLVLVAAADQGDRYEYLVAGDLKLIGCSPETIRETAWANFSRSVPGLPGRVRYRYAPDVGWTPPLAGEAECAALLADVASIRALHVKGKHLAFAPSTSKLWISGTEENGLAALCNLARREYDEPQGKPLTPAPLVLGDDNRWQRWLPTTNHPLYWLVRELHIHQADELYEEQRQLLAQQPGGPAELGELGKHFTHSFPLANGGELFYSWSELTEEPTVLPKTDMVQIQPAGREPVRVAWDTFAEAVGHRLKPLGLYPERYFVAEFPSETMLKRLARDHIANPKDLFAGADDAPISPVLHGPTAIPPAAHTLGGARVGMVLALLGVGSLSLLGFGVIAIVMLVRSMFSVADTVPQAFAPRTTVPASFPSPLPRFSTSPPVSFPTVASFGPALPSADMLPEKEWSPLGEFPKLGLPEIEVPLLPVAGGSTVSAPETIFTDGDAFADEAMEGAWLVGFRLVEGREWGGVPHTIQPIYQLGGQYELGQRIGAPGGTRQTQVLARPGYAVSAIHVQRGLVVNTVLVTFSRVADTHLDLSDSYQSGWLGGQVNTYGGGEPVAGGGAPIVGISGRYTGGCFQDLSLTRAVVQKDDPTAVEENVQEEARPESDASEDGAAEAAENPFVEL